MIEKLLDTVVVTRDGDEIPSSELLQNETHCLCGEIDASNRDIYLKFSSRQALYDFARSLLQEAVHGMGGQKEFYPLISDGKALVVEGARLVEGSSRIFVAYGESD
ncbi:hypothetical protein JCM19000A_42720 [Silvimonas sp. JCM 19000]